MKTPRLVRLSPQQGSTLAISLTFTAIVGLVLGSYLSLVGQRNLVSARSQTWNSAISVLEAGIEEAFTHLKVNSTNLTTDGWSTALINGQTVYKKQRDLSTNAYFLVTISNVVTAPVIYSAGYVRAPIKRSQYISRLVRVTTVLPAKSQFTKAIFATTTNGTGITMSGDVVVDSFNSTLGPYSPSTRLKNGGLATNSRESRNYAIKIGTAYVFGSASTGPNGTVYVDWVKGGMSGTIDSDMNVATPVNTLPTGKSWMPFPAADANGVYTLPSGYYDSGSSKDAILIGTGAAIDVTGNAVLWLKRDLTVGGQSNPGYIKIEPGATLTVYSEAKTVVLGGQGVINPNGLAANFSYIGLTNAGAFTYSSTTSFYGTVNAPQSGVTISGGAAIYGAIICKTFTSSGSSSVHYDEGLGGGGGTLTISSWREL